MRWDDLRRGGGEAGGEHSDANGGSGDSTVG
jgi:hypothetical protein